MTVQIAGPLGGPARTHRVAWGPGQDYRTRRAALRAADRWADRAAERAGDAQITERIRTLERMDALDWDTLGDDERRALVVRMGRLQQAMFKGVTEWATVRRERTPRALGGKASREVGR